MVFSYRLSIRNAEGQNGPSPAVRNGTVEEQMSVNADGAMHGSTHGRRDAPGDDVHDGDPDAARLASAEARGHGRADRRVRRTRAALRDALLGLVVEHGYDAVTVQDVIDRADVGRSTFYAHFRDKDDLLDEGLQELRAMLVESAQHGPARRWLRFSPAFLEHLGEMRSLVRAVFGHDGNARIRQSVEATLTELVTAELGGRPAAGAATGVRVRFVVGAYLSVLAWWLTEQPHLRPADVDAVVCALVVPGLDASTSWT